MSSVPGWFAPGVIAALISVAINGLFSYANFKRYGRHRDVDFNFNRFESRVCGAVEEVCGAFAPALLELINIQNIYQAANFGDIGDAPAREGDRAKRCTEWQKSKYQPIVDSVDLMLQRTSPNFSAHKRNAWVGLIDNFDEVLQNLEILCREDVAHAQVMSAFRVVPPGINRAISAIEEFVDLEIQEIRK